jgi:ABC-type transport system substrate-binding protein
MRTVVLLALVILTLGAGPEVGAQAAPAGDVVIAWHVTIAPTWFDPSTAPPQITPFGILFALHDALVRPLPGKGKMSPSLAESWTESPDGLVYEFKLRRDLKFHNGDPVTTEDVSSASSATVGRAPRRSRRTSVRWRSSMRSRCDSISPRPGRTS